MKELVHMNDQHMPTPIEQALEIDRDGCTTAKKLYRWLELNETHYSRRALSNITENPFAEEGTDYSPLMAKSRKGVMGRPTNDYRLSAAFAKKLAMTAKSERGELARIYFLMCEKALSKVAEAQRKFDLERAKGIAVRKSLTEVILLSGENERMQGHAYAIYTDAVYKAALGSSAKQFREERGLGRKEDLREHLTADELAKVSRVEHMVGSLLEAGFDYDGVKAVLADYNGRRLSLSA